MASKYAPLGGYLRHQTPAKLRLSFREVEAILGFELPPSARKHPPWWENKAGSHVQARAWLEAGWRTAQVDVPGEAVSFERALGWSEKPVEGPPALQDGGSTFVRGKVVIDLDRLSARASNVLGRYLEAAEQDLTGALSLALDDAALERRRRLLAAFPLSGTPSPIDSTDLIREARDAR